MQNLEIRLEANSETFNPYGIQLDAPMQKNALVGACEMKPMGFPQDARWYWDGSGG